MRRKEITAEELLLGIQQELGRVEEVDEHLGNLVEDLRAFLPEALANDIGQAVDDLREQLTSLADRSVDEISATVMEHAVPEADVGCATCDSPDFSNQTCPDCAQVRSDGLTLARRLAGWLV